VEAATELVIREVKKKKAEDAVALQKALEVARDIEVPASSLSGATMAAVAEEIMNNAADLQGMATSEVGSLMVVQRAEVGAQEDLAAGSEAAAISGNSDFTHSNSVIDIESDSNPSQSNSSSSSTDIDDIPLDILYKSNQKGHSSKAKLQKKPSKPTPYKPMDPPVDVKIGELLEMRSKILPLNHPLQPQIIQPLNMIAPDDHVEPSLTNQTEDTSVLYNLSSHLSGELPGVVLNLEKASEVESMEAASESPQQHTPELQKTPTNPEQVPTTVLEQSIPEHYVSEQTTAEHILTPPLPELNAAEFDGMVTSDDSDIEMDQSSVTEIVKSASDQPSTSNTQSILSNNQSSFSLAIEPLAAPKPTKIPSPPTIFLDSVLLQGVCEDIAEKMIKLIQSRNDLNHRESYEKQWSRLKERVDNIMSALQTTCIDAQDLAKQKLQGWINGIDNSLEEVKVLRTWVKNPLSLRGREVTDFIPNYVHLRDLDLSFLTKVNLRTASPDLALVQRNVILEQKNQKLEKELLSRSYSCWNTSLQLKQS